jgi:hypothetical protein
LDQDSDFLLYTEPESDNDETCSVVYTFNTVRATSMFSFSNGITITTITTRAIHHIFILCPSDEIQAIDTILQQACEERKRVESTTSQNLLLNLALVDYAISSRKKNEFPLLLVSEATVSLLILYQSPIFIKLYLKQGVSNP